MNGGNQPTIVTVRALLAHFHSILQQTCRTSEPVIIALRGRKPAGVLLGYETWQALVAGQVSVQRDTSTLQAQLAAVQEQVAEMSHDLATTRQRVTELEGQLARLQPATSVRSSWTIEPSSQVSAPLPGRWSVRPPEGLEAQRPPAQERWKIADGR